MQILACTARGGGVALRRQSRVSTSNISSIWTHRVRCIVPRWGRRAKTTTERASKRDLSKEVPPGDSEQTYILEQAQLIEKSLMNTLKVQNERRFRVGLFVAVVAGALGYWFYPRVKKKTSSEIASVAGGALEDEEVQKKAEMLAKAVVHTVLNDPTIMKQASNFLVELFKDEHFQRGLREEGLIVSNWIVKRVLEDPNTTKMVVRLLGDASRDPAMQKSLLELSYWLLEQEPVRKQLVKLTNGVLVDPAFLQQSAELGMWVSHQVLDDVTVYKHSCDFCMSVLSDRSIQDTAGTALWESVKGIVSPSQWFYYGGPDNVGVATESTDDDNANKNVGVAMESKSNDDVNDKVSLVQGDECTRAIS